MRKLFGALLTAMLVFTVALKAQVYVEAFPMDPQTGSHNYFGVRVTLAQTSAENVTVTGYIYDEGGGANTDNPFTLTVTAGYLTAETAANFYETDPTASAVAELGTIGTTYAGVFIVFEVSNNILRFNSMADINTVLDQLEADYDEYNDNYESNLDTTLSMDQLDSIDVVNGFDEAQTYKNFENLFAGYNSKRSEIESTELTWLANSFSSTDPDDVDLTFDDAENTIFNGSYSFKVGNDVYQLTSTGMYKNSVLQEEGGSAKINTIDFFIDEEGVTTMSGPSANLLSGNFSGLSNPRYSQFFYTDCKSNKKNKLFVEYNNGQNRVKATVAITSIIARNGVHGKIKNYKLNNGNWKPAKAKMAVYCYGTYYTNQCADSHQFTDRKPTSGTKRKKKISTRRHSPAHIPVQGTVWKTYSGQVAMYGEINNAIQGQLTLTF